MTIVSEPDRGAAPRRLAALVTPMSLGLLWIAALRLVGLGTFPRIEADEGGWPMSVRLWLDGTVTYDYYMAPGYHWLLGVPFRWFGANLAVSRAVSAVLGLVALYLLYRLARRLAGEQTARWSVLLMGTCQASVLLDRRAFMEPFQLTLMLALALVIAEEGR
jgi:4-amino-4-deoxy-L-arabinose transferase-like glycosyltransferase